MRVYVASSWRNYAQQSVVYALRRAGHEVYDFRHPPGGDHLAFAWSEVDPDWQQWTPGAFVLGLMHPAARAGFESDMSALRRADATVLVMPCGRSAHLELGYAAGRGQRTVVLIPPAAEFELELMYGMAELVTSSLDDVVSMLGDSADDERVERAMIEAVPA